MSADPLAPVRQQLREELRHRVDARGLATAPRTQRRVQVRDEALSLLRASGAILPQRELTRMVNDVSDEVVGFGPIEFLLQDPEVTEVMVNGPDDVYVERGGRIERAPDGLFEGEEAVLHLIERIVGPLGLRVDESSPWADARLPDGSRVHSIDAEPLTPWDNPRMTRAAIYVRISRDPSGEELGVKRQEADCRKLAKSRGWDVVAVFPDNDRSATSGKPRPQWNALLDAIEANQVDAIVAYSSSRMYRRLADLGRLLDLLKARPRFKIATVKSGQIDLSSADGRMLANILASVDEAEVDRIRERVSRARQERTAAGRDAGGSRPFGYEAKPTGPPRVKDGKRRLQLTGEIVPKEAELIRDAAARLLNGESIRSILRDWDARGIRTPRGGAWRSPGLRHMLRNPRLIGIHPETGERANWKPILDRRTHDAIVSLYADPTRLRSRRGGRWRLTGLLFCGICGGRLTGRPSGDSRRRYVCDNVGGVHLSIAANPLESLVIDGAWARHPDFTPTDVRDPQEQADLMAKIDDVDRLIAEYVRDGVAEGLGPRDVGTATSALRREREHLEAQLADAQAKVPPAPLTYIGAIPIVEAETRAMLEATIERIEIAPAKSMGGRFDPARVKINYHRSTSETTSTMHR